MVNLQETGPQSMLREKLLITEAAIRGFLQSSCNAPVVKNLNTFSSSGKDTSDRNETENINQEECDVRRICGGCISNGFAKVWQQELKEIAFSNNTYEGFYFVYWLQFRRKLFGHHKTKFLSFLCLIESVSTMQFNIQFGYIEGG